MYTVRIIRGGIEPDLYLTAIRLINDTYDVDLEYSEIINDRKPFLLPIIQQYLGLIIREGITVEITENSG